MANRYTMIINTALFVIPDTAHVGLLNCLVSWYHFCWYSTILVILDVSPELTYLLFYGQTNLSQLPWHICLWRSHWAITECYKHRYVLLTWLDFTAYYRYDAAFSTLRVFALSKQKIPVSGVVLGLSLVPISGNIVRPPSPQISGSVSHMRSSTSSLNNLWSIQIILWWAAIVALL